MKHHRHHPYDDGDDDADDDDHHHNVTLRELHHHACIRKSRSNLCRSFRRRQPEHTPAYARLGSICVARPVAGDVGDDAVVNSWWSRPAFGILYAELNIVQL